MKTETLVKERNLGKRKTPPFRLAEAFRKAGKIDSEHGAKQRTVQRRISHPALTRASLQHEFCDDLGGFVVQGHYDVAGVALASLTERLVTETIMVALPGARMIDLWGEINEDWLRLLRIQRVVSGDGEVLFDAGEADDDPRVEAVIDEVNTEYLDLLLDLTGGTYMGTSRLELESIRT